MAAKEANLLVTFDPTHEFSAKEEIQRLMGEVKDKASILRVTDGLAEVLVKDARKAVKALTALAKKNLDKFSYTSHWIPIDKWSKSGITDMQKEIAKLAKGIKPNEKWKMDLKVRKVKQKPDEIKLILKLTEVVDRMKVDLDKPDKIIKAEIIGSKAGLALLDKDELLNITKLKQK